MNFGEALENLKQGKKAARKGWNGKGQFVYMTTGSIVPVTGLKSETAHHLFGDRLLECDTTVTINSHLDLKTAQDTITIGWAPSQTDMLSEDWEVVE